MTRSCRRSVTTAVTVTGALLISGCGTVKGALDVVGGAGQLTFGVAKATVDLAQGGVRVAQGGIELVKGAGDLSTHAATSTLELMHKGIETAGSAVKFIDKVGNTAHRGRMRNIAEARGADEIRPICIKTADLPEGSCPIFPAVDTCHQGLRRCHLTHVDPNSSPQY